MDRQRYLQHIGFAGIPKPDLLTLQQLHRCHMLSVPFENLSIIYRQGIHLEENRRCSIKLSNATAAAFAMS